LKRDERREFKHRIYQYVLRIIRFVVRLSNDPVVVEIKRQLTKSGSSVGANYFEALGASSKRDFQNYFTHALKSANESKFWLAILRDAGLVEGDMLDECNYLLKETKELANIFASSILTMKGKKA